MQVDFDFSLNDRISGDTEIFAENIIQGNDNALFIRNLQIDIRGRSERVGVVFPQFKGFIPNTTGSRR